MDYIRLADGASFEIMYYLTKLRIKQAGPIVHIIRKIVILSSLHNLEK